MELKDFGIPTMSRWFGITGLFYRDRRPEYEGAVKSANKDFLGTLQPSRYSRYPRFD